MTEPFQIIGEEMETDILVVDDEAEWLDTLRVLFEMKGWNVATASSAGEGLRLASARSFALVLCDLAMPGMSGMDMLKELFAYTGISIHKEYWNAYDDMNDWILQAMDKND